MPTSPDNSPKITFPKITEFDETDGGFIFELDHGESGYVRRLHDGTYIHYRPGFTIYTPPDSIASAREIAVASYFATHITNP